MPKPTIALFFETVYNDKALQGDLNAALCHVAPEVVVEIAGKRGFDFSVEDLQKNLGDSAEPARITEKALATKFWGRIFEPILAKINSGELSEAELSEAVGGLMRGGVTYPRVFSLVAGPPRAGEI